MTTTFAGLKAKLLLMLDDEVQVVDSKTVGVNYVNPDHLQNAIDNAIDAILPWWPKPKKATIPTGVTEYALPTDFYKVNAVGEDSTKMFLEPANLFASYGYGDDNCKWMQYPSGSLTLTKALTDTATLFYSSKWGKPASETAVLETPTFLDFGLCLSAAHYLLLASATTASDIRQWLSKMDQGLPIHNPRKDMSVHFYEIFLIEMSKLPNGSGGGR